MSSHSALSALGALLLLSFRGAPDYSFYTDRNFTISGKITQYPIDTHRLLCVYMKHFLNSNHFKRLYTNLYCSNWEFFTDHFMMIHWPFEYFLEKKTYRPLNVKVFVKG